ncbi:OmpA family protein [Leclercia sp.]|uniref:OmpA family protein n=1 Tax=Leclercia sp. TaxID=1898428 RepID=UPI002FDDF532
MSVRHLRLLWLWGGLLAALVCQLFLPLSSGWHIVALLLLTAVVIAGWVYTGRRVGEPLRDNTWLHDLPDAPYRLPVVLVCGNVADWPGSVAVYRTAQGCWLKVATAELQQTARYLLWKRPELVSQLAVMFRICPQQEVDEAAMTARLYELRWQMGQVRRDSHRAVPLLLNSAVAGVTVSQPLWQTALNGEAMQVWQPDEAPCSIRTWLSQKGGEDRLAVQVRMSAHVRFVGQTALSALVSASDDMPLAVPSVMLYHMSLSGAPALDENLWQRWLSHHTTLNLLPGWQSVATPDGIPLPDFILPMLPQGGAVTPQSRALLRAFCMFTLATVIALCASAWNNKQLLQRVSFDIQHYDLIAMNNYEPKANAVEVLREDAALLDQWARNGEPMKMSLGLYHGERLRLPLMEAIRSYVPPPLPVKQVEHASPKIIRLDSMSLFDTGRWALKPGSTRLLVNSLVGIKAKPGWLIVVTGHTDSVGDDKSNQTLSLKRAESVRDWMRDTGDVPESCFAVQGYGESRPVATNDTPEGRALNRRVEISLVPQANACQIPGITQASSQDDDASLHNGE